MDDILQISIQILKAFEICLFIGDKLRLGLGTLQSAIGEAKQGGGARENKLDFDCVDLEVGGNDGCDEKVEWAVVK